MEELVKFLPNIKFTHESSKKRVAPVGFTVSLENGSITIDLHKNYIDCHQHLHCSFSYPNHTKKFIIYSQNLRLRNDLYVWR